MAAPKPRKPYAYPTASDKPSPVKGAAPLRDASERQESLRQVKMEAEQLRDQLQTSILDNPKRAKKAAMLLSLWIEGKARPRGKR